jgi:hypothetical protein
MATQEMWRAVSWALWIANKISVAACLVRRPSSLKAPQTVELAAVPLSKLKILRLRFGFTQIVFYILICGFRLSSPFLFKTTPLDVLTALTLLMIFLALMCLVFPSYTMTNYAPIVVNFMNHLSLSSILNQVKCKCYGFSYMKDGLFNC